MKFDNIPRSILKTAVNHYADFQIPIVVISIICPGEDKVDWVKSDAIDLLTIEVHDINQEYKDYVHFNAEMADRILQFYEKYKNKVEVFLIHCAAGFSRSAGVAAALAEIHGQSTYQYFTSFSPNTLIRKTILEQYYRHIPA